MLSSHDIRGKDTAGGIQRIHGRVNTLAGNLTGKYRGGIQMGEGGSRSRVGQVIGGYIDGLNGSDGAFSGGSDTLLKSAHLRC